MVSRIQHLAALVTVPFGGKCRNASLNFAKIASQKLCLYLPLTAYSIFSTSWWHNFKHFLANIILEAPVKIVFLQFSSSTSQNLPSFNWLRVYISLLLFFFCFFLHFFTWQRRRCYATMVTCNTPRKKKIANCCQNLFITKR